jgi:hypothetical protein
MEIINIYGSTYHGRSCFFLEEVSAKLATLSCPLVMGGDFNLIRLAVDKNNHNLN